MSLLDINWHKHLINVAHARSGTSSRLIAHAVSAMEYFSITFSDYDHSTTKIYSIILEESYFIYPKPWESCHSW